MNSFNEGFLSTRLCGGAGNDEDCIHVLFFDGLSNLMSQINAGETFLDGGSHWQILEVQEFIPEFFLVSAAFTTQDNTVAI
jgi:hypothetical protein